MICTCLSAPGAPGAQSSYPQPEFRADILGCYCPSFTSTLTSEFYFNSGFEQSWRQGTDLPESSGSSPEFQPPGLHGSGGTPITGPLVDPSPKPGTFRHFLSQEPQQDTKTGTQMPFAKDCPVTEPSVNGDVHGPKVPGSSPHHSPLSEENPRGASPRVQVCRKPHGLKLS